MKLSFIKKSEFIDLSKYEIMDIIGEGGFGEVYLIKNKTTNEFYAAKIALRSISDQSDKMKRDLNREVKIISQLNFPSVLKFVGFNPKNFKDEEKPVIVTEYLPNNSLSKMLEKERDGESPPEWNNTKKLICLYGIAAGMSYLYKSKGVIHRDLKPQNILLDIYLYPKICDFGLSKNIIESLTSSKSYKGTLLYTAPEIFHDYSYSTKSDVYSYAYIAYEILTGEEPIFKKSIFGIIKSIMKGKRPTFKTKINVSLQNLINRCWDGNPKKRPAFDEILRILSTDKGVREYLTDDSEYLNYIKYVTKKLERPDPEPKKVTVYPNQFPIGKQEEEEMDDEDNGDQTDVDQSGQRDFFDEFIDNYNCNDQRGLEEQPAKRKRKIKKIKIQREDTGPIPFQGLVDLFDDYQEKRKEKQNDQQTKSDSNSNSIANDPEALYKRGIDYMTDEGRIKSAIYCFEMASELGHVDSMKKIFEIYYDGIQSVEVNYEKAIRYGKMAADKGDLESIIKLANILKSDNMKEAFKYFRMAAECGDVDSAYNCASLIEKGVPIEEDEEDSIEYYKAAADGGHKVAMYKYAMKYLKRQKEEKVGKIDFDLPIRYLELAASLGYKKAIKDKTRIKEQKLDYLNDPKLMFKYAKELESSSKKPPNESPKESPLSSLEKPKVWYKKAADLGYSSGMTNYARILHFEIKIKKDNISPSELKQLEIESTNYYKKAALKKNSIGMLHYGFALEMGKGVEVNKKKAVELYHKSAAKGNVKAMVRYGNCLENGIGIKRNAYEALKWYKKAADFDNENGKNKYAQLLKKVKNDDFNEEEDYEDNDEGEEDQ